MSDRPTPYAAGSRPQPTDLADLLERVLDKGVVLAGDIKVNLLDIELLTIKIRLLLVSVDKAAEMGIDWWRSDPFLSSQAAVDENLRRENELLHDRIRELEEGSGTEQESLADLRPGHAGSGIRPGRKGHVEGGADPT